MSDDNLAEVLSKATKLTPKNNESAKSFTGRIIKVLAGDDFPTDDWDSLTDDVQEWVNEQIRAQHENKDVEEVPGYDDFLEDVMTTPKPTKINGSEVKSLRTKHPSGVSAVARLKELLLDDMQLTPGQLHQKLESEGYSCANSTVISVKADFKSTLLFLQSKGLLTQNLA